MEKNLLGDITESFYFFLFSKHQDQIENQRIDMLREKLISIGKNKKIQKKNSFFFKITLEITTFTQKIISISISKNFNFILKKRKFSLFQKSKNAQIWAVQAPPIKIMPSFENFIEIKETKILGQKKILLRKILRKIKCSQFLSEICPKNALFWVFSTFKRLYSRK